MFLLPTSEIFCSIFVFKFDVSENPVYLLFEWPSDGGIPELVQVYSEDDLSHYISDIKQVLEDILYYVNVVVGIYITQVFCIFLIIFRSVVWR